MGKFDDDDPIHDRISTHFGHFSAVKFSFMSVDCSVESSAAEHFMNSLWADSFVKNNSAEMLAVAGTADMIEQYAVD